MTALVPLLHRLFAPDAAGVPQRVFAILDAARDPRIYPALISADCDWLCLYRGEAAARMAEVAPYLVELHPLASFTWWLLAEGWGNSWGVFVNADLPLERLQAHFRRFLMVQLPDGKTVYFRFYDPRVLRVYLPTCDAAEREAFWGPVKTFIVEAADGREAVDFAKESPPC